MTDSRLRDLLTELADEVDGPPLAAGAWAAASRIRRRRRWMASTTVGALAAGTVAVLAGLGSQPGGRPSGTPPAPGGSSAGSSPAATSQAAGNNPAGTTGLTLQRHGTEQIAPLLQQMDQVPTLRTRFSALGRVPGRVPMLSAKPVSAVIAAVQQGLDGPVLVLGADGGWRQVDVALVPTTDGGNLGMALKGTAISPDGRRLAFPQPTGVVVVEVGTGRSVSTPLDGYPEQVRWLPDGSLAVGGARGTVLLRTGQNPAGVDYQVWDLAAGRPSDPLALVTESGISRVSGDGRTVAQPRLGKQFAWSSAGWSRGDRVARGAFVSDRIEGLIVVLDLNSGSPLEQLALPLGGLGDPKSSRGKAGGNVAGWLDDRTVLLLDGNRVLAWRPESAELFRVVDLQVDPDQGYALAFAP